MYRKQVRKTNQFFHAAPDDPFGAIGAALANGIAGQLVDRGLKVAGDHIDQVIFGRTELPSRQSVSPEVDKQKRDSGATNTQSANITMQRSEIDLHVKTEILSGSLQSMASSSGLRGAEEEQPWLWEWQHSLRGRVIMFLGKRGSGKTASALTICEFMAATYSYPVFWVNAPPLAEKMLPSWFRIVKSLDQCPCDCVIFTDECGLSFLSLDFTSGTNLGLRQHLMLCRQKNQTMIFAGQHTKDFDQSIVRQSSCTIFKELALFGVNSERSEVKSSAMKAAKAFQTIPKEQRLSYGYVVDDGGFEGLVRCPLPSFWSESLSNAYGRQIPPAPKQHMAQTQGSSEPICLGPAVSDTEIRNLRTQGHGYEKIAKLLKCTPYRVRQCLVEFDPLDGNVKT